MSKRLLALAVFIAVSFGLAYLIDFLALVPALERHDRFAVLVLGIARMCAPFLGVVAATRFLGLGVARGLASYGLRIGVLRYVALGILVPYALYAISVALGYGVGMEPVNPVLAAKSSGTSLSEVRSLLELVKSPLAALAIVLISSALNGSTVGAIAALGEEMGWRGFLLGELGPRLGLYPAAIVIGIVWSLWHAPLILLAGYNYPHHPDLVGLSMFTAICVALSIILCQLRALGKSVLPPSFAHGNLNAVSGWILLTFRGDEILTSPVGLLGLASLTIIAIAIGAAARRRISGERLRLAE